MSKDNKFVRSLVESSKGGNSSAFEQLFHVNSGHIYALCLRLTGDQSLSAELTKKSFINAWTQIPKFDESESFSTWLAKITASTALKELNDKENTPNKKNIFKNVLDEKILELPDSEKTVFILHDVEKIKHEDVAELLNISTKESKKLLIKGRLKLMKAIS